MFRRHATDAVTASRMLVARLAAEDALHLRAGDQAESAVRTWVETVAAAVEAALRADSSGFFDWLHEERSECEVRRFERCTNCGVRPGRRVHMAALPVEADRVAVRCPLCGPLAEYADRGPRLTLAARYDRQAVHVDVAFEGGSSRFGDGEVVLFAKDKGSMTSHSTRVPVERTGVAWQYDIEAAAPSDQHVIVAVWVHPTALAYARMLLPVLRSPGDVAIGAQV